MARIFIIVAIFATVASVSLSLPSINDIGDTEALMDLSRLDQLDDRQIGIPTDQLLKALESQFSGNREGFGRGANFFNLSAYLNTNRPANTTALTFVPLITLLLGFANLG